MKRNVECMPGCQLSGAPDGRGSLMCLGPPRERSQVCSCIFYPTLGPIVLSNSYKSSACLSSVVAESLDDITELRGNKVNIRSLIYVIMASSSS
jgi:hypothetical protein